MYCVYNLRLDEYSLVKIVEALIGANLEPEIADQIADGEGGGAFLRRPPTQHILDDYDWYVGFLTGKYRKG